MASYHFSIKSGRKGKASQHAAYIVREGKYGRDNRGDDLAAKEHGNLPAWADNNPLYFFKMADEHERVNGSAYRELEVALPLELTLDQNLDLMHEFIKQEVREKPYLFAIHEPQAALSGVKQPHAHIMLSDRIPDGIERAPDQHFSRFNPSRPDQGGCKKISGGKDWGSFKSGLMTLRENWAKLQNQHLEQHGHEARVDHRSNRDRGIDSEREPHFGHVGIQLMTPKEKQSHLAKRQGTQQTSA